MAQSMSQAMHHSATSISQSNLYSTVRNLVAHTLARPQSLDAGLMHATAKTGPLKLFSLCFFALSAPAANHAHCGRAVSGGGRG